LQVAQFPRSRYYHFLAYITATCLKGKLKRPPVERQMYYNNNTAQHSLLREEILEKQTKLKFVTTLN